MPDQFDNTNERRVAALEDRVAAEAESVKEHFAELQSFITSSLARQTAELKSEVNRDVARLDTRMDSLEARLADHALRFDGLERRLDGHDRRFDGLDRRIDQLERKVDAHHQATSVALAEVLRRLPAPPA